MEKKQLMCFRSKLLSIPVIDKDVQVGSFLDFTAFYDPAIRRPWPFFAEIFLLGVYFVFSSLPNERIMTTGGIYANFATTDTF